MLRITIELIPNGDFTKKRILRIMDVSNTSLDASSLVSDYHVEVVGENGSHKRQGIVRGHDRKKFGAWALVARAIRAFNLDLEG
jgi:hypothetical protein